MNKFQFLVLMSEVRPPEQEIDETDNNEHKETVVNAVNATAEPTITGPPPLWDEAEQCWVYTDPATGSQYVWIAETNSYVPKIDTTELAKQQAIYVAKVPPKPKESNSATEKSGAVSLISLATESRFQRDYGASKVIEADDGTKYVQQKVNKSIYVQGLPKDVRDSEFVEFFSRAGVLKKDPETKAPLIKLYRDENGIPKGDALVTYFRPESIPNAFVLLDEAEIRPGFKVKIEEAKFKIDENTVIRAGRKKRGKRKRNDISKANNNEGEDLMEDDDQDEDAHDDKLESHDNHDKNHSSNSLSSNDPKVNIPVDNLKVVKRKKKKVYDQSTELSWEEVEQKHVILKKMFKVEDAQNDIEFYDNLKAEIMEECQKLGHVESVKVFERNPEGVVAVKFATGAAAEKCVALMNGRLFDGTRIIAEYYDGFSNYYVAEKDEEYEKRDEAWASWLGDESAKKK